MSFWRHNDVIIVSYTRWAGKYECDSQYVTIVLGTRGNEENNSILETLENENNGTEGIVSVTPIPVVLFEDTKNGS